ncbi:hypothetical protein PT974_03587 [Cladobotryum mycophilum]|uniref:Uncharacterized protein n=1 Tax=Cladobotryum mycophilum TaxID=491253 RepID=A0ABR0SU12_9HYPO
MTFEHKRSPFSSLAGTMSRRDLTPALASHTKYLEGSAESSLAEANLGDVSVDDWMKIGVPREAPLERGFLRILLTGFDSTDGLHRPFTTQAYNDLVNLYGIPATREVRVSKFLCTPTQGDSIGIVQTSDVAEMYMALEYDPATETSNCVIRFVHREDIESMNKRLLGLRLSSWHPLALSLLIVEQILRPRSSQVGFIPNLLDGSLEVWLPQPKEFVRLQYKVDACMTILDSIDAHQDLFKTSNPNTLSAPGATTFIPSKLALLKCTARNLSHLYASLLAESGQTSQELMNKAALAEQERNAREALNTRAFNLASYIFLPMTAMATVFSMSFFDFKPTGGGAVSSQLWIFFVVVIPVSLILNMNWMLWAKWRENLHGWLAVDKRRA